MAKDKCIYHDIDKYMVRIPMYSIHEYMNFLNNKSEIEIDDFLMKLCRRPEFREAILIASENLYNKMDSFLEGTIQSKKKLEDFKTSVLKYYIRMCARTTPFGLFSCVGEGEFVDYIPNDSVISKKNKKVRPDFEWIMNLVKDIESKHYRLLNYDINHIVFEKGNRISIPYVTGTEDSDVNLRNSRPVQIITGLCKQENRSFNFLLNHLKKQYPTTSDEILDGVIKDLVEKEILISSLRPPLAVDELAYIIGEIKKIPELAQQSYELEELYNCLQKYNQLEIGAGEKTLKEIIRKMKNIVSSATYVQLDTAFEMQKCCLDKSVSEDIQGAVELFFYLSQMCGNRETIFSEYQIDFIEKYGEDREVPICEMLDNDFGIGAPYSYIHPYAARGRKRPNIDEIDKTLSDYFWNKYQKASEEKMPILIEDDIWDRLLAEQTDKREFPVSLELNFMYKKVNQKNVFYLGPNIGSTGAGKTFGRFAHLNSACKELFYRINEVENAETNDDFIFCELSYIPQKTRLGNVVRNEYNREYIISLYTNSEKPKEKQIYLDDIWVGIEKGKFYLKSKRLNKKIRIRTNNMLNVMSDTNLIRFLKEIEQDEFVEWSDFVWSRLFGNLPHIPEIRYRNFVLCPETWRIEKTHFTAFNEYDKFIKQFNLYKKEYNVPRLVYISDADNRLMIDLDNSYCMKILYKTMKKEGNIKLLACEIGEDCIFDEQGNNYCCEIVVPLLRDTRGNATLHSKENVCSEKIVNVDLKERCKMFGSDWLFLKLYGAGAWQDNLIMYYVTQFANGMVQEKKINKYFFMRYADPEFHIRLRFQGNDILLYISEISDWLRELCTQGLISRYEIGCYDREIERYGGIKGIEIAEDIFYVDSQIAEKMLCLLKENKLHFDKEMLGAISAIFYMEQFGWDFNRQLKWLNSFVSKTDYKVEYGKVRKEYEELCNSDDSWYRLSQQEDGKTLIDLLGLRQEAVEKYRKAFNENLITTSEETIIGSLIHLSFNRLFGINREFERKVLSFTRHTLYSLKFSKEHKNEN